MIAVLWFHVFLWWTMTTITSTTTTKSLSSSWIMVVNAAFVESPLPLNAQKAMKKKVAPPPHHPYSFRNHDSGPVMRFKAVLDDDITSDADKNAAATYYSPNVPLDQSRYYYSTNDEENEALLSNENGQQQPLLSKRMEDLSSTNEYSFFDEAFIVVRAGSGGQGSSTYKKGIGGQDGIPDGGNGGRGGNVILVVDDSLNTLAGLTNAWRPNSFGGSGAASFDTSSSSSSSSSSRQSFRAENGADGSRQYKNGRTGNTVFIRVPPGTVVQEEIVTSSSSSSSSSSRGWDTKEEDNDDDDVVSYKELGSLTVTDTPQLIVAHGGEGGEGSGILGNKGRGVKRARVPPQGGDRKVLKLTLKIVADVALVGVPNCGKSTLLASVTRAKPKIANVRTLRVVGVVVVVVCGLEWGRALRYTGFLERQKRKSLVSLLGGGVYV
jgi:GTPase involved in cell partitioning and DNA repair